MQDPRPIHQQTAGLTIKTSSRRSAVAIVVLGMLLTACIAAIHPARPLYTETRTMRVVAPDAIVLAATLSIPRWASRPTPAVVMVHGSGRLTRRLMLGDTRNLARMGVAVLAYDKRGVGESGGTYRGGGADFEVTLRELAGDAASAMTALRAEPRIDSMRVGYFGASQAGWIIPLASSSPNRAPRFAILLSAPAVSTGVENYYSHLTGDGSQPSRVNDESEVRRLVAAYDGPMGFDHMPTLERLTVPSLWLLGDRDMSVPTFESVRRLDSLSILRPGIHEVVRFATAGHDLRDVRTRQPVPVWPTTKKWLQAIGVLGKAR